jgi:hypothetical protein
MTLSIRTLSIMTLSMMTHSIMTQSIMTHNIRTHRIMALCIIYKKQDTQHKKLHIRTEYRYAGRQLFIVMLNVIMLSVVMLCRGTLKKFI